MNRTLVIGDIHGGYKALLQVLKRANVTSEDTLIFLGDYVDGWSESAKVIQELIHLSVSNTCVFIRGNHDLWCGLWLEKGATNPVWLAHGGKETISSYVQSGLLTKEAHKEFFNTLKDYYLDEEGRLFVHAGFTSMHGVGKEEYDSNYYWDRTLWESALLADKVGKMVLKDDPPKRFSHYSEIYIGHTPTIEYGKDTPIKAYNLWNMDTGAGFKGKLTIMDIDTKEYWQSDLLPSLYPNEQGRN
ncbi:serine/threonine protein phosphatase 1 [Aquimarina sp. EL_43]|uniref:metallophosphoesterase n=1 Tax=unclassified Aquimarina TaxID=2627091 RepID=UPI0018CBD6D0|nr:MULTISPECIES: metallophosphoesterase [unclassified Aquimarina]MBG6128849.1 serine/threonine protein phosphatase 1 [Aquimarina sp. EL_35]MBG6149912.1 serine/threonine protein phosphatase 1 [Aquimarina sp. EL_32]MBG6167401.1 serine/threonine protein phosphatase 1 [Aquimarina sp. EL_43]